MKINNYLPTKNSLMVCCLMAVFALTSLAEAKKGKGKRKSKKKTTISAATTEQAPAISAELIIKKSDQIRNPDQSFLMQIEVTNSGSQTDMSAFEVSIDSKTEAEQKVYRTLIKTILPKRDAERKMLMVAEDMWAYIPNLKRAVRISLSQKLTGQAANGDISRMRLSGDYSPVIESETSTEWVVHLKAQKKGLTYEQVRLWVEKNSFKPLKAEFLTSGGKVLKKAIYQNYKELAGRLRPSEVVIQDAVTENEQSTLTIKKMEIKNFPETLFDSNTFGQND